MAFLETSIPPFLNSLYQRQTDFFEMSKSKFLVAEFFEENPITVEAFPLSWLLQGNKTCLWPLKCTPKLLRTADSVPAENWILHSCRVFAYFGKIKLLISF